MQLTAHFPVMARAMHAAARTECSLFVSRRRTADVPEVSARETEIALPSIVDRDRDGNMRALPELRFHGGRLYRIVARDRSRRDIFERPYSPFPDLKADFVLSSADAAKERKTSLSPLSAPLQSLFWDRLDAGSTDPDHHLNRTWPPRKAGNHPGARLQFERIEKEFKWIDEEDVADCAEMARRQMDRLLLIDGAVWYETRPPVVCVDVAWTGTSAMASSVHVGFGYLPDVDDHRVTRVHFPLSEIAKAAETAEKLKSANRMKSVESLFRSFAPPDDHPAFEFDTTDNVVERVARTMSLQLLRHASKHPERIGEHAAAIKVVWERFMGHNPLLGAKVDHREHFSELAELWKAMKPPVLKTMGHVETRQVRRVVDYVSHRLDEAPISLFDVPGLAP
jgi:hypothetical protein